MYLHTIIIYLINTVHFSLFSIINRSRGLQVVLKRKAENIKFRYKREVSQQHF